MERRDFVKLCAAVPAAAGLPTPAQAAELKVHLYSRARLVDAGGKPLKLKSLQRNVAYVFDYPYSATPCFLIALGEPATGAIDLKTESGDPYRWAGGVGVERNIVAYSAICAHKMTYPTKQVSFIGFRAEPSPTSARGKVITCCSDRSVYDPFAGAKVLSGPAPQPLATIVLEYDAKTDEAVAAGAIGGEMFDQFFKKYSFRLDMEMGPRARSSVSGTTPVSLLDRYSAQWAQC
jgi:Rieske Fe-S protein